MSFSLRSATEADWDFIAALTEKTMRGYAEQTWGQWIAQSRDGFDPVTHQILQDEGGDIGCLDMFEESDALVVRKLYIAPDKQNRGIGAAILHQVMQQARALEKPVRLSVLTVNPAKRFYERLGFAVTEAGEARTLMIWRPSPEGGG